jgi:AcrR family transcriptional regulator
MMYKLLSNVRITVPEHIYLKDPESSELGKKIIVHGIELIDKLGYEAFNFKKLSKEINTTEASIYRYFESKHKLLLYITAWYWGWMEYRLMFGLANIQNPQERLEKSIEIMCEYDIDSEDSSLFDYGKLHNIIISESTKTYLTKEVDEENKEGVYLGYKQLVARISEIILEINSEFKYPRMLVSTVIEGVHLQRYFSEHLPSLTDNKSGEDSVSLFYKMLVFNTIKTN